MLRRLLAALTPIALVVPLVGSAAGPASAVDFLPYVTVNSAPAGSPVTVGDHFDGQEFDHTRPLSDGAVGPAPVFYADDGWGCLWNTASASGSSGWIGLAQRDATPPTAGDACPAFQQKLVAAEAAGASALIVINNVAGTAAGTGAAGIPGVIVDQAQGQRLRDAIHSGPVQITLGLLDSETFLPPGTIFPSKVGALQASPSSGKVSVTGAATFGTEAPVSVGIDDPGDGPTDPQLDGQTGVDLVGADISEPDASASRLMFQWHLSNMPSTGALPEVTFFRWGITIGGKTNYVLQAKFSNLVSTSWADDQTGPAENAGATFQLRGGCGLVPGPPVPVGVNNCHSLAFLEGQFDQGTKTVRMYVPLGESYAPDIVPGAVVTPFKFDAQPIVAGYSAGVANGNTEDGMDWDTDAVASYTIPSGAVTLGIAPAGTDVSNVTFGATATVAADGSFSGSLSTSGLASGSYDVWAKACFAANCGTSKVTISL